jgi:tRNA-dihydrouridine synthase C
LLVRYSGYELFGDKGKYYPNRVKQWLGYLSRQYPEAKVLFMRIRALKSADEILQQIQS